MPDVKPRSSRASIVVGHSMGAVLAVRLAKTRPGPLRAAILTGCFFTPARNGRTVLIVHARDDHHVPIDFAIAASRRHTDWSLDALEHGGHHAHVTEPHLWAAAVTAWLDEHPEGAA